MMMLDIERAQEIHWSAIRRIYEEGIASGNATLTAEPPLSWEEWTRAKILPCCLVARSHDRVVGWIALGEVSVRSVYAGVADINVYVDSEFRGQGIGSRLLSAVIAASEENGIWTLEARIFPENEASIRLHLKHGFRNVGRREKIGRMGSGPHRGTWRDVLLFERRSLKIN